MSRRILLVRAVNVGGAKLPMAEFRELLTELGATEVQTYIASGNAIVEIPAGDRAGWDAFDRAVEAALTARYGYTREVMSRDRGELEAALAAHPFEVVEPKFSYVSFLSAEPNVAAVETAEAVPRGEDLWRVIGRELHLRYADGAGRAELDHTRLTKALGVAGTARNLLTVRKLVELAG
ncbi:MAG: DUF1697 domain-containing protein [Actinomycetales bacterium]|nr:DUF1697 domain-containing protein [Actinomycetales bacterium]